MNSDSETNTHEQPQPKQGRPELPVAQISVDLDTFNPIIITNPFLKKVKNIHQILFNLIWLNLILFHLIPYAILSAQNVGA